MATGPDRGGERETSGPRGRVLVADDSKIVRAIVGGHLTQAGYLVETAANGVQAVTLLESGTFDVVVTDLEMPELDGFGVLEAIKKRSLKTEVVILTAAQDISAAIRALRLGAHDFLTKPPASPDEVVLTVDRAAEKKQLREANVRLMRELEALTRTDALTGLQNRRVFDEALARETSRFQRYHLPLSLLMLDIDHFKKINDAHGHPAGDGVLRLFARLTQTVFRDSDAIHRYGGEEFAVLLPHTQFEGAMGAARRLVASTAKTPFPISAKVLNVTVSAGVATLDQGVGSGADLVARADAQLYEAKRAGRNRAEGSSPASGAAPKKRKKSG
jgi:diguanylate cyclase (GGDEF)-like protein